MKNVKRDSKLSRGNNSFRKVGLSNKNNEKDVINSAFSNVSCVINSFLEVQKEREKTLQIQSEANARILESNNKLVSVLAQEKVKIDQIKADFIFKMNQVKNEKEKNKLISDMSNVAITRINALENTLKEYDVRELQHNEYASKLLDMLHTQVLSLTQQIPSIKA